MKTLRHCLLIALLATGLSFSNDAFCQHRGGNNGGNRGNHRTSQQSSPTRGNAGKKEQGNKNNSTRPGNNGNGNNHNANPSRPGNNGNGNNHNANPSRPGNNGNDVKPARPGHNGNGNGYRPGNSAARPGTGGHYNPHTPAARPMHKPRWERPLPPPPSRHTYRGPRPGVPRINMVLGISFGSLFNYGVNQLIAAGYNVAGTYDNMIYLSDVPQFGIVWPQVTMYYGVGGMTGARFQYGTPYPGMGYYNTAYNNLYIMYGMPVGIVNNGVNASATWWGGNNVGYITLTYGPGTDQYGAPLYYTDMVYGL